ncbi:uncharacterized protein N7503_005870 [Penicillium pulvis]|uniref:uncharacterized protein n=1 Tax=Penicillium pulvis TaxID=1562058 RepID=UPI002547E5A7|nr:uncharacterized protein N7503_005870 [Penicillium pulvis]KAJ5803420.1 hypothetical protein N7503_005870 [Penicillium pulvis]
MATPARVKTRICMISDTHTNVPLPADDKEHAFRDPLPKADVLLHAGDLTKVGYTVEYEATVSMLKAADAELKLVIAGNHDITLDEEHFTTFGYRRHRKPIRLGSAPPVLEDDEQSLMQTIRTGSTPSTEDMKAYVRRVKDLWTNQSARDAGIRYLEEGVHSFTLSNGAKLTVYASPYQPEFYNWAFGYPRSEDRYNPPSPGATNSDPPANPVPDHPNIDIMLTHGPPAGVLDLVGTGEVIDRHGVATENHVGCAHLLRAAERARPRIYLFGHIHEGWGGVRGTWDTLVDGGVKQEPIVTNEEEMLTNRGVFYDMSSESGDKPLEFGKETLFINASICTLSYRPKNAPWVVDLDLPLAGTEDQAGVSIDSE